MGQGGTLCISCFMHGSHNEGLLGAHASATMCKLTSQTCTRTMAVPHILNVYPKHSRIRAPCIISKGV